MKKLTAGIFTALLGLVTVNAANAAIPSTNYVDTKIQTVTAEFEAADRTLGTRIDGVESAYKAADTELGGRVTELETTVGEGTMVVATETQADVIAAINALDAKTNGIASNAALETLQNTVSGHETDITGLETRMGTAEGEIDTLQSEMDAVEVKAAANESAITVLKGSETTEGSVAKSVADAKAFVLQEASDMAAMAKADANKYTDDEISALTTTVNGKASQADLDTAESAIADNAAAILLKASQADLTATNAEVAKKADAATMTTELAKKVDIAQGAEKANHVVITDTSGNVTTSATITQGQVENLTDDLAAKMTDVTAVSVEGSEDGVYVLTAKVVGDETTYKWELIERTVPAPM